MARALLATDMKLKVSACLALDMPVVCDTPIALDASCHQLVEPVSTASTSVFPDLAGNALTFAAAAAEGYGLDVPTEEICMACFYMIGTGDETLSRAWLSGMR